MQAFYSITLGILYTVIAEGLVFRFILGKAGLDVWAKVFFINVASFVIACSIAVTGFFTLGWPFATSWGASQWFLLIVVSEFLPLAIIFGPLGFRRVFILLVFANIISSILICYLLVYAPTALLIPSLEMEDYEYKVEDGIGVIKDGLERYFIHNGEYPAYIYGGDQASWSVAGESLDPLLKKGYLESYPMNPYHLGRAYFAQRRRPGFNGFFWGMESDTFRELKKAWGPVVEDDPRFGYRAIKMGNILSNPSIPTSSNWQDYHVYRGSKDHQFFLPGAFLYKAFDLDGDGKYDSYILAGFGSENTVGMDIYNQSEDTVTYMVAGKLVPGRSDRKHDGVIVVETGGFKKWRE